MKKPTAEQISVAIKVLELGLGSPIYTMALNTLLRVLES